MTNQQDTVEACKILLGAVTAEVNECVDIGEVKARLNGFKRVLALC